MLHSSKKSIPFKTEAGLRFALLTLLLASFLIFKFILLQREGAPIKDEEMVLL